MAGLGHVFGGALAGVGEGLAAQAQERGRAKRERALEELRHQRALQRDELRHEQRRERMREEFGLRGEQAEQAHERTLERDRLGHEQSAARDTAAHRRQLQELKRKAELASQGGGGQGPDTLDDKRALELALSSNKTVDPETGMEDVDWPGVLRSVEARAQAGQASQALLADIRGKVAAIDQAKQQQDARAQATAEADARRALLKSRASEFPETGGDMAAWIEQRTQQILAGEDEAAPGREERHGAGGRTEVARGDRSGAQSAAAEPSARERPPGAPTRSLTSRGALPAQREGREAGSGAIGVWSRRDPGRRRREAGSAAREGRPSGQGTQESPYRATTQAHIDWFLANAPAGAVIEANGQLFTK